MKRVKQKRKKVNANYYVNNSEFYEELKVWLVKRKKDKLYPVDDNIALKIYKIVHHYSFKPNFFNYTYKDKLISEALYTCIRYVDRFDPNKSKNPFAYFTRVAWSSFIKCINEERKASNIKKKLYDKIINDDPNIKDHNLNNILDIRDSCDTWNPLKVTFADGTKKTFKTKESYDIHIEANRKEEENEVVQD